MMALSRSTPLRRTPMATKRTHTGPTVETIAVLAARSGGRCEFPGCTARAQDPHHRYERGMGGSPHWKLSWINLPVNLLAACRHHNYWCSNVAPRDAFDMGWRIRRGDMPWLVPAQTIHHPLPVLLDNDGGWRPIETGET